MKLGVCYYPEHWPRDRWPRDAALMRQVGLSLARIAEFAWAAIEPDAGRFDWDWLDEAIHTLTAEGVQIILGTPTASPPPWLCRAHPEILPVDAWGRRRRPGSRRHYCPNSPTYRQHTLRIVEAMAARYGHHPAVSGWQIDNEFGCHGTARCYCETCAESFRHWLKNRYGKIDALNDAWGTVFWSQTYQDWHEIDPPILTVAEPNPSHVLDYYRFSSASYVSYQQLQIDALRSRISDRQFITTNFMSQFSDLNYADLAAPLDLVSMSSYPTGHAESGSHLPTPQDARSVYAYDVGDPTLTGFAHALMRGFKPQRPFWVMEQQCGNVNWSNYNTGIRPGTVRLWTWHALASGAEAVLYFRWRAGLLAQEQFHSGLLHHDASPAVGFGDLEAMKADQARMAEIAAQPYQAKVALLLDYDSIWATQLQPHHRDFDSMRLLFLFFRALQRLGLPADVVSVDTDLSPYRMVIAPALSMATAQQAASLGRFAESGGTVLVGVRSGCKTPSNRFTDLPLPGVLSDLVGITATDWHSLPPGVGYDIASMVPGLSGPAVLWAEALRTNAPEIRVLAHYTGGPFQASAALTERKVGAGQALYLGWHPSAAQAQALLAHLAGEIGLLPLADVPEGMIVSRRGPFILLLNFAETPLTATVQGLRVQVNSRDVQVIHAEDPSR